MNLASGRDPQYTCTATGEDLLKEIKMYRRLELWGEGFSWYDCKRWGDPVVRPSIAEGGNYSQFVSGTFGFDKSVIMMKHSGNGLFQIVKVITIQLLK